MRRAWSGGRAASSVTLIYPGNSYQLPIRHATDPRGLTPFIGHPAVDGPFLIEPLRRVRHVTSVPDLSARVNGKQCSDGFGSALIQLAGQSGDIRARFASSTGVALSTQCAHRARNRVCVPNQHRVE